jgi:methionine sulfoxide reductase catalytic subunit
VTTYNNFYEFGTDKSDPARYAGRMKTDPWSIKIEGETTAPGTYALKDVVDFTKLEERIYRLRCVEAWSMVIPWVGVPLSSVIAKFKPTSKAKYVQFITHLDRSVMPGVRFPVLQWPYSEGLRMDEAMNELTFLAVGVYGKALPQQNGAPVRLVVPWKYGFKYAKSIATVRFTETQPPTSWNIANRGEYGFYSNVNPNVDHPRWSQASERVIGGSGIAALTGRRKTEMFNGYEKQVAHLYKGMDLNKFY